MKIAFVGLGNMGRAIVPELLAAEHEVFAWNRTAAVLHDIEGVKPLREPRDAFAHDVVISMLADDRAVRDALISTDAISQGRAGRIHIVMSTISLAMVDELKALHAQSGVAYIAAPVFGVPAVAATGGLNILAAGPIAAIEQVQPLFDVMGKKTWRLGDDQAGANVAKIAGNLMITQAIESMAEATALTEAYGLSAKAFLDIVTQTMFASPSYQRYAQNIATDTYEPGFKLTLGLKDVGLAIEAAQAAGLDLPMSEVVRSSLSIASSAGLGDKDWSALARAARGELVRDCHHAAEPVSVLVTYTGQPESRFDRAYYEAHHIPMVEQAWRPLGLMHAHVLYSSDRNGMTVAACLCQFSDADSMRSALDSPDTAEIMADIAVFTDIVPMQHILRPR